MRAAVIREWGGPENLAIETVSDPVPREGEVVVDLRATSLNWHDVIVRQSGRGAETPSILGMDGAGIRTDTGEAVVIYPCLGWVKDSATPSAELSVIGDATDGTYAQRIAVPSVNLLPKPTHLSWEEAAALPCAGLTAYRAVSTRAQLRSGETVLVAGAGSGVSTFAVQYGAAVGARVIVTSSSAANIESAQSFGAVRGFRYTDPDWVRQVRDATNGGVDVVISGAGSTLADSIACLAPGGRVVVYGSSAGRSATIDVPPLYFGQLSVLGTTMGSPTEFAAMLDLVVEHRLRPIIDSVHLLDDIATAHRRQESSEHMGKVVITLNTSK
jgi:NADPH:quinone reductase-like Zn-dependent oxidoreductase